MEKSERRLRPAGEQAHRSDWRFEPRGSFVVMSNDAVGVRVLYLEWLQGDSVLYRQPLLAERGGSAALAVDRTSGRFCLVRAPRPYVIDVSAYRAAYPQVDPDNLGRMMWEAPRGLSKIAESYDGTARREAEEELRCRVVDCTFLCNHVSNSTFFPQPTNLSLVTVDLNEAPSAPPDDLEGIGARQWFSLGEYRALQDADEAVDGTTAHLICAVMLRYPGLLR